MSNRPIVKRATFGADLINWMCFCPVWREKEAGNVLRYTDSDGDELVIAYDPLPDEPEDVWIGVDMEDRSAAVRVPAGVLRRAVERLP